MRCRFLIGSILLGSLLCTVYFYANLYLKASHLFSDFTGQTPHFYSELYEHRSKLSSFNILVLGLDKRDDWLEKNSNTDTIMLVSVNFNSATVNMISLPRDLWDPVAGTKINAIYPDNPHNLPVLKQHFSRITGQSIDRVLVIKTSDLAALVDTLGFVDVYNSATFTDNQYPNPRYITDPAHNPMYMTVSYPSGWNRFNASQTIPFIRSRKSLVAGSDLGRIKRQQDLIESIRYRLLTAQILVDATHYRSFYNFFHQLETDLSDQDITNIVYSSVSKISHLTPNPIDISSLLEHPDTFPTGQWVFLATDSSYSNLHSFIAKQLK